MAGRTIDDSLHALDVGLPGTIGTTVRVGNSDTERNTLVAKLALCHPLHLLAVVKSRLGLSFFRSRRKCEKSVARQGVFACKKGGQRL